MTLLNDIDVGGTKYKYANSIPMGTCATPAGSEVKECVFADSFELAIGNLISVTFTYANTYGDGSTTYPKLLINGTQYPVKQPVGGYASSGAWANGQAVTFMFDGTNLVFLTVPVVDTVANGNMNSVSSNAVYNSTVFRRVFDNTSLSWLESDIVAAIRNIINFYVSNVDIYEKEVRNKTVIIQDIHYLGGSGCLILTDNGLPYFEGIYYTFYQPYAYTVHANGSALQLWRFTGELIHSDT